jgi:dihydroorotate dehydrogenase (NAD+) catalytic subunit
MMNAVGYANPGIEEVCKEYADLSDVKCPVIGSALGETPDEFAYVVSRMGKLPVCAIELPLSCPHTPGFGLLSGHTSPKEAAKITKAAKKATKKPIIIKLSPSIPNVGEVAHAVEKAGADAINCGNSVGPGMIIDIETGKPVLGFGMGGVHGPAIRPLAVRCVFDIYEAVKIPIIGCGGITTGRDAIEMIEVGATAVGVGTATYYRGEKALALIADEMRGWMKKHNYKSLDEMRGIAHGKK